MEYSVNAAAVAKGAGKQRKPMRVSVGVGANSTPTNGHNSIGITTHPSLKNGGTCSKCGFKRRHARTCPLKKKGEDEDDLIFAKEVVQKMDSVQTVGSNAGSLFCYLDVAALKRYKKHYRLKTRHNSTKAELANAVRLHFENVHVNEFEVIDIFLMKVKTNGGSTGSPSS